MKVNVNAYNPNNESKGPALPNVLVNLRKYMMNHIGNMMRIFGIESINVKPIGLGLYSAPQINFRPMEITPGDVQVNARNTIVRQLAHNMLMVGILDVSITLEEQDVSELKSLWATFERKPEEFESLVEQGQNGAQLPVNKQQPPPKSSEPIPLNIETDPTGESVLNNA